MVGVREDAEVVMEKEGVCLVFRGVFGDGENMYLSYELNIDLIGFVDGLVVGRREGDLLK